jgi:hypothetical protein
VAGAETGRYRVAFFGTDVKLMPLHRVDTSNSTSVSLEYI